MINWTDLKITDHAIARYNQRISVAAKPDICRRLRQYWRDGSTVFVHGNMESRRYGQLIIVRRDDEIVTLYSRRTMFTNADDMRVSVEGDMHI